MFGTLASNMEVRLTKINSVTTLHKQKCLYHRNLDELLHGSILYSNRPCCRFVFTLKEVLYFNLLFHQSNGIRLQSPYQPSLVYMEYLAFHKSFLIKRSCFLIHSSQTIARSTLNSSLWRQPPGYPTPLLLQTFYSQGIPILLESDSGKESVQGWVQSCWAR